MTDADSEQPDPLEVEATPYDSERGSEKTYEEPPSGAGSNMAWAMACHLTALIDFGFTILTFGLVLPLVIWLWKKDEDPEVAHHGKESLNFQLNLLFWWLVSLPLTFCCIGFLGLAALPIIKIVFVVIAALRTAEGERYRYPYIYRVIE
jgi:hypothetical protein